MRFLFGFAIVAGLCGCGKVAGSPDAAVARDTAGDASAACDRSQPFGAPITIAGVDGTANETWASLSPDELSIYFASDRAGGVGANDLYVATRTHVADPFGTPILLAGVNTAANESSPMISADGLTLFAGTNASGKLHIVTATRPSIAADFSALVAVSNVNTAANNDGDPSLNLAGTTLYFASDRGGGYDIYRASRVATTAPFGSPTAVAELNSTSVDDGPAIRADELEIFFASNRAAGPSGRNDIWHATRSTVSDGFGTATMINELSMSTSEDYPVWVSQDGCRLYFSSDRPGGAGGSDLWIAARP